MRDLILPTDKLHSAVILIGSNISPERNVELVLNKLVEHLSIQKLSSIWETASIGIKSPNFLNLAFLANTNYFENELKCNVLRKIELDLGRVHTGDKCAPRTMDLDIILFDDQVVDEDLWENAFIALPVAELFPEIQNPMSGESLIKTAKRLQKDIYAIVRPDLTKQLIG